MRKISCKVRKSRTFVERRRRSCSDEDVCNRGRRATDALQVKRASLLCNRQKSGYVVTQSGARVQLEDIEAGSLFEGLC